MKLLKLLEVAQKGDTFAKGDRVAVDAERGKGHHSTKSWWLGTVVKLEGTKIVIRHDDDDETDSYPFSRSQTDHFIKLPKTTKVTKRFLNGKEVRALLPAVQPKSAPQVKTPSPATVRPTVTERTRDTSIYDWIDTSRSSLRPEKALTRVLTEAEYRACPWLGVRKSTGRASSTTAMSVIIGMGSWKNHFYVVSVATGNESILYSRKSYDYGSAEALAKEVAADYKKVLGGASQMPYREFCNLRLRASEHIQERHSAQEDRKAKARDSMNKHYDKLEVGKQVLIKFSNGHFWKRVEGVDYRNNKVGISGSGSKLRWISLALIEDVRDAT